MRLLNTETLEVEEFLTDIPIYAILSHTWEQDEVTFQDMRDLRKAEKKAALEVEEARKKVQLSKVERIQKKAGWLKIEKACNYVRKYKFKWIWIDTCCIDKSSSAELSEALNSMYKYYGDAHVCIAYLSDRRKGTNDVTELLKGLKECKWFTRGWTLQELIAPTRMVFLDQEWNMIGTRFSMRRIVSEVTSIPVQLFEGSLSKGRLEDYSIAQKMSWAASRRTTREEDMAYCLMGLFEVNMPPIYGEGGAKAFMRLQHEIIKYSDDRSIFAWIAPQGDNRNRGLFARSPSEFLSSSETHKFDSKELGDKSSFSVGNNGLRIHLSLQDRPDIGENIFFASLHCRDVKGSLVGIYLRKDGDRYVRWCPHFPLHHTDKPMGNLEEVVVKESTVPRPRQKAVERGDKEFKFDLDPELTLLGEVDDDGALHSKQSFSRRGHYTVRLRTINGNEFDIALYNRGDDIIPVVLDNYGSIDFNDYRPLRDSHLSPIANENFLASCFVHRMGDSNRRVVEIDYIPSSSPKFEYYCQIDKFRCTSRALSSTALNFTLDARSNSFDLYPSSSVYPSDLCWDQRYKQIHGSIPYPSDQCDIHCVFGCIESWSGRHFL